MVAPIGVIIFGIVLVIPSWRIFKQTGMSPAWSLFVFPAEHRLTGHLPAARVRAVVSARSQTLRSGFG